MVWALIGFFSVKVVSDKKLHPLYADSRRYNVITNIKAALAKRYMCNACDTLYGCSQMWKNVLPVYCHATLYQRLDHVLWDMQKVVSQREMFSELFDPQIERVASLPVETGLPKW